MNSPIKDLDTSELPIWRPREDSENRKRSALALAKTIVSLKEELTPSHLKEFLSNTVWKYTECDGKYTTRFRSRGAILTPKQKLNHEHVITRKELVGLMIAEPKKCAEILETAFGCTVLKSEHTIISSSEKQNPKLRGWERYAAASVQVYDLKLRVRVV